jgi:hypothetical protein
MNMAGKQIYFVLYMGMLIDVSSVARARVLECPSDDT